MSSIARIQNYLASNYRSLFFAVLVSAAMFSASFLGADSGNSSSPQSLASVENTAQISAGNVAHTVSAQ